MLVTKKLKNNQDALDYCVIIQNENGAIYLPAIGWFDPVKRQYIDGVSPSRELAWFGADENFAYGCDTLSLGNTAVYKWNLKTSEV